MTIKTVTGLARLVALAAVIALGLAEADAVHSRDAEGADSFGLIKIG